jgi:hypothetical protein
VLGFDQDFSPFACLLVELVEPLDGNALGRLGMWRRDVADVEPVADTAATADVADGVAGQRSGMEYPSCD